MPHIFTNRAGVIIQIGVAFDRYGKQHVINLFNNCPDETTAAIFEEKLSRLLSEYEAELYLKGYKDGRNHNCKQYTE